MGAVLSGRALAFFLFSNPKPSGAGIQRNAYAETQATLATPLDSPTTVVMYAIVQQIFSWTAPETEL
jgi:hypothetical protein